MPDHRVLSVLAPQRFTAFVDAVVAIAMTLLILPLMESVSGAAAAGIPTAEFLIAHQGQLVSFVLSFVLIAAFWMEHYRVYSLVEHFTPALAGINILWLFTIVWLPVPTSMVGQMRRDWGQILLYIGTLMLTQVATLWAKAYLLRHPELTQYPVTTMRRGIVGDVASITLFIVALVVAVWLPTVGYLALFVVALTKPVARWLERLSSRKASAAPAE